MRKVREIKIGKAGASDCADYACDVEVCLVMRDGREVRGGVTLCPDVCDGDKWESWGEPHHWVSGSILAECDDDDDGHAFNRELLGEIEALTREAAEAWRPAWEVAQERKAAR